MTSSKIKKDISKLNLGLALAGVVVLFLLFLINFLTFYRPSTEYNETGRKMSYILVFGSPVMIFLILGFSISSIMISVINLFNRVKNRRYIIALVISFITLAICIINFSLQYVYERDLVDIFLLTPMMN